ncbi:MAG: hypothetical protein JW827_10980 [Spirochaetes bacterium]|nr:hypothetical protein [Spirochaetota bacterium]
MSRDKTIVLYSSGLIKLRVFASIPQIPGTRLYLLCKKFHIKDSFFSNYDDIKDKKIIYFKNKQDALKKIKKLKPDVVITTTPDEELKKYNNTVFAAHGLYGKKEFLLYPQGPPHWEGFSLYCGADKDYYKWLKNVSRHVVLNTLPQFDLAYKYSVQSPRRDYFLSKLGRNFNTIILFIGYGGRLLKMGDVDDDDHDCFKAIRQTVKWARKNNALVILKLRKTHKETMKFLIKQSLKRIWTIGYILFYAGLKYNKNVYFAYPHEGVYFYFFADKFILTGSSTTEVEAALTGKPVILFKTKSIGYYDSHDLIKYRVALPASSVRELKQRLNERSKVNLKNIRQYKKERNILFDGRHGERLIKAVMHRFFKRKGKS